MMTENISNRAVGCNLRKSLIVGAVIVGAVQIFVQYLDRGSPSFFCSYHPTSQKYSELESFAAQGDVDVLIVGHSQAALGVDAQRIEQATGLRTYNFGIASTDTYVQATLIRDYLAPKYQPRVILWHLPLWLQNGSRVNRELMNSAAFALQRLPGGHRLICFAKNLLPYQKRMPERWIETIVDSRDRRYDEWGYIGSLASYGKSQRQEANPEHRKRREFIAKWKFPIRWSHAARPPRLPEKFVKTFDETEIMRQITAAVKTCQKRDIRLHTFVAPMLPIKDSADAIAIADGVLPKDEAMSRALELLDSFNVKHLNYRDQAEICSDHDLFADVNHLNRFGAEKLTDLIIVDVFEKTLQATKKNARR
ncbi:MAG: hypothetical protein MK165_16580 [Pirellulaceae bacterium]|nr:hypothetical protein [Pirellulaceae bacterium]